MVAVRAAAHLFVADLHAPAIGADDRHHVERVLRLRDGETVTVSDSRGGLRVCRFVAGGIEPVNEPVIEPRRVPAIGVGFALMKGTKPEWIVQKLTECGVDRVVPFTAARSVVRWDEEKGGAQRRAVAARRPGSGPAVAPAVAAGGGGGVPVRLGGGRFGAFGAARRRDRTAAVAAER